MEQEPSPKPNNVEHPLFLVATVNVVAGGGKTAEILRSPKFSSGSPYYDEGREKLQDELPENQLPQAGEFSSYEIMSSLNPSQVIESHLDIEGDENDSTTLRLALLEGDHLMTVPAILSLIERHEAGEDVGIGNLWNIFFTLDKEGLPISVVLTQDEVDGLWALQTTGIKEPYLEGARVFFRSKQQSTTAPN